MQSLKEVRKNYVVKMLNGHLSPAHVRVTLKTDPPTGFLTGNFRPFARSARSLQHCPWSYKLYSQEEARLVSPRVIGGGQ